MTAPRWCPTSSKAVHCWTLSRWHCSNTATGLMPRVAVETRFVSWGTGLVDLDNDGYPDIFVVTGRVYPEVERKLPDYPYKTPRILFRNLGNGIFEELTDQASPAIPELHSEFVTFFIFRV